MQQQDFFARLWADYLSFAPSARPIHTLLGQGHAIVNDHIALRTFNTPELGLEALEPLFTQMGFALGDHYFFQAKKLRARYYQHPDPEVPKIFISELLLEQCSEHLRALILPLCAQVPEDAPQGPEFLASGRHWDVSHAHYQELLAESEYAAWVAALGFRANHFTVSVNHLPGYASVAAVNAALKEAGFALNTAGGEIKGSPEVMLEQSSTLADRVPVAFSDGEQIIPGCFYEFAYRYPQANGELYPGFVEASADKIFESTDAQR